MQYNVEAKELDGDYEVTATITDNNNTTIAEIKRVVGAETKEQAIEYGTLYMVQDLKMNNSKILKDFVTPLELIEVEAVNEEQTPLAEDGGEDDNSSETQV